MSAMAVDREHLPKGLGTRSERRLRHELGVYGVHVPVAAGGEYPVMTGVSRRVDAAAIAGSTAAADQVCEQAFDILVRGETLSVSLAHIGTGDDGTRVFAAACDALFPALREAGAGPGKLEIVVDGNSVMPQQALDARRSSLGDGIVHVLTRGGDCRARQEAGRHDESWQQLWSHRTRGALRIAYGSQVTTPCPLLGSETADTVLPLTHAQVPAGTAWQQFRVDLGRLQRRQGRLCEEALEHALRACVELGELLHEKARWPTAQMRADAWLNRRLGIALDGIGDLVLRQAMDPAAFSTLGYLGRLMVRVKRILWEQSREIALRRSHLPAIERTDPRRMLPNGARRDDWHRRWTNAVAASAIRHRNLLALSPWCVFPSGRPAEFRFADLLPVLRFADVCTLSGAPDVQHWDVNTFRAFHLRAVAVLQQRDAAHEIAEGC